MFSLKNLKKLTLGAFVFLAMAAFASSSFAQLDCSTKTGEEKKLCEEQKNLNSLALKPMSANLTSSASSAPTKLKGIDQETINKNYQEAKQKEEADAKRLEATKDKVKNETVKGSSAAAEVYDKAQERIQKSDEAASRTTAVKSGNDDAKKAAQKKVEDTNANYMNAVKEKSLAEKAFANAKTPEEIAAASQKLDEAKKNLKQADDAWGDASKELKKAEKADKKADKKLEKEFKKEQKAIEKEHKKEGKAIEKDIKSAEKEIKKLEKECKKDSAKCDAAGLAAAKQKLEESKLKLDAHNAVDEDEAADEIIDAEDDAVRAAEQEADALKAAEQAKADRAAAPKRCEGVTGLFAKIACKTMTTLADLRQIVYLFAGFGLIAFAWSAIFNKISWKHFAQISISLFLLSMMGTFIGYFGYDGDYESLTFGQYLQDGHPKVKGSNDNPADCTKEQCKNFEPEQENVRKKWSLKDLKGTVQAGISAIQTAHNTYKAAKSTVENAVNSAKNIGNAIKNGSGGLDGILNTVNVVANETGNVMNSGKLLANNLAASAGSISENVNQFGMTNDQREQRAKDQERLQYLTDLCNNGGCEGNSQNARLLQQELAYLQDKKSAKDTGVNAWLKNDGKGGGATILAGIEKTANISTKVTNTVQKSSNAAQSGSNIGGDGLGAIFGIATAVGEGVSMSKSDDFNFKSGAKKREEAAAAQKKAYESSSDFVKDKKVQGTKTIETRGDGSVKTTDSKTGVTSVIAKDGTVTTTAPDGSTVVSSRSGIKTVTDSNGSVTVYNKDGGIIKQEKAKLVSNQNASLISKDEDNKNGEKKSSGSGNSDKSEGKTVPVSQEQLNQVAGVSKEVDDFTGKSDSMIGRDGTIKFGSNVDLSYDTGGKLTNPALAQFEMGAYVANSSSGDTPPSSIARQENSNSGTGMKYDLKEDLQLPSWGQNAPTANNAVIPENQPYSISSPQNTYPEVKTPSTITTSDGKTYENAVQNAKGEIMTTNPDGSAKIYDSAGNLTATKSASGVISYPTTGTKAAAPAAANTENKAAPVANTESKKDKCTKDMAEARKKCTAEQNQCAAKVKDVCSSKKAFMNEFGYKESEYLSDPWRKVQIDANFTNYCREASSSCSAAECRAKAKSNYDKCLGG